MIRHWRTILVVWLWELCCALIVATPVHGWAREMWGRHPEGDALIFKPAGRALLAWVLDDSPALSIVVRTSLSLIVVFTILNQLVLGSLVSSLVAEKPSLGFSLRAGARAFTSMLGATVLITAVEVFFFGVGILVTTALDTTMRASYGDAIAAMTRLGIMSFFVVIALIPGVLGDLVRVDIARSATKEISEEIDPLTFRTRVREALFTLLRRGLLRKAFPAWAWRAAIATALVILGGIVGDRVGGAGGGLLIGLFVLHQTITIARVVLRMSWLDRALTI